MFPGMVVPIPSLPFDSEVQCQLIPSNSIHSCNWPEALAHLSLVQFVRPFSWNCQSSLDICPLFLLALSQYPSQDTPCLEDYSKPFLEG